MSQNNNNFEDIDIAVVRQCLEDLKEETTSAKEGVPDIFVTTPYNKISKAIDRLEYLQKIKDAFEYLVVENIDGIGCSGYFSETEKCDWPDSCAECWLERALASVESEGKNVEVHTKTTT